MATPDLHEILDRLYAAPLAEFVKLRNEAAKELRASGRKDEASEIKTLKKPSVAAWAVNQLHFRRGEEMAALAHANEAIRDAHSGSGKGLQQAIQERRRCVDRLVQEARDLLTEAGNSATRNQMRRVMGTLEVSTTLGADPAPGRLHEDLEASGFGALAGLSIPVPPPSSITSAEGTTARSSKPKSTRSKSPKSQFPKPHPPRSQSPNLQSTKPRPTKAPPGTPLGTPSARAAKAALQLEEAKLERAEREVTRADTEHLAARRRIDRARSKIDDLQERLEAARAALVDAESDATTKGSELKEAKDALARAHRRVESAREAVDLAEDQEAAG